ncbi:hypothetical protein KQH41_02390, partial [bacterium]|nr:hypothetical protein [bacterium]
YHPGTIGLDRERIDRSTQPTAGTGSSAITAIFTTGRFITGPFFYAGPAVSIDHGRAGAP